MPRPSRRCTSSFVCAEAEPSVLPEDVLLSELPVSVSLIYSLYMYPLLPFTVTAYHTSLLSVTVMAVPPGITPSEL